MFVKFCWAKYEEIRKSLQNESPQAQEIKSINTTTFINQNGSVYTSRLCRDPQSNFEQLLDCHNNTFAHLLDRHAPLMTKTITVTPQVPWYSEQIRKAKRERRRAERRWRSTRTAADFELFKRKKNRLTYLLKEAKSLFLTKFMDQNTDDEGELFRAVGSLLS